MHLKLLLLCLNNSIFVLSVAKIKNMKSNAGSTNAVVFLNKKTKVFPNEIILLEGNVNYTIVHFEQKTPLLIAITLKKVESLLKDYGFLRIHKRYIINMDYANNALLEDSKVLLRKNISIKVSRRKRNELKERLAVA